MYLGFGTLRFWGDSLPRAPQAPTPEKEPSKKAETKLLTADPSIRYRQSGDFPVPVRLFPSLQFRIQVKIRQILTQLLYPHMPTSFHQ